MLINSCQMIYEDARCKSRLSMKWTLLRNSIIFTHLLSGLILNYGLLHLYSSKQLTECQKSLLHRQRYGLYSENETWTKLHFCFIKISILRSKWFKFHISIFRLHLYSMVVRFQSQNSLCPKNIYLAHLKSDSRSQEEYTVALYANQNEKKRNSLNW